MCKNNAESQKRIAKLQIQYLTEGVGIIPAVDILVRAQLKCVAPAPGKMFLLYQIKD